MSFGDINRVNTNLQALSSQYSLNKINSRLADNQLKLSTGLRINRAEDDAAGFSIASKLSGRIAGLEQAERNVGDAKSMLDVAETGVNSIMDILVEMKSKATQAGTDSIGSDERGYIADQLEALATEINSIVDSTSFQGTKMLEGNGTDTDGDADGTGTQSFTFQVGEGSGDTKQVDIDALAVNTLFSGLIDTDPDVGTNDENIGVFDHDTTNDTSTEARGELKIADDAAASEFRDFIGNIDTAIGTVAGVINQMGIDQNSLSIRQENLSQAITSNSAARSRIQDADFAKIQSESVKLQIMQQTATSALAQANTSPQAVLGFLGG
ncbi:MAG: flagellin [Balneolaceae bacterium]|nr:flagellin [Balneolaceae bacterium]